MGDLSENFSRSEFKCNCGECGQDTVDYALLNVLQRLRDYYNLGITITSGNRCPAYNRSVGGAKNSSHVTSKAADIQVSTVRPEDVYSLLDQWYPNTYGIGLYNSWVHIDVRDQRARWNKQD